MLAVKYILKAYNLLEFIPRDFNSNLQVQDNNYSPSVNQNTINEESIIYKRSLKIDPKTGERYFDFLD